MHLPNTAKIAAFAVCCHVFLIQHANAADCRWFGRDAQSAIKSHVRALQGYEHEASDRLKGHDSRPFEFLLGEARRTAAVIGEPKALADEEDLKRCRNATRPIRRICAEAAQMLAEVLEKHVATTTPEYEKARYASAMSACEKLMDLKPLKSAIRGTD